MTATALLISADGHDDGTEHSRRSDQRWSCRNERAIDPRVHSGRLWDPTDNIALLTSVEIGLSLAVGRPDLGTRQCPAV